jgi:hypothetical protein
MCLIEMTDNSSNGAHVHRCVPLLQEREGPGEVPYLENSEQSENGKIERCCVGGGSNCPARVLYGLRHGTDSASFSRSWHLPSDQVTAQIQQGGRHCPSRTPFARETPPLWGVQDRARFGPLVPGGASH